MKERIEKEIDRLQSELNKGTKQREDLRKKLNQTETQMVFIQGSIRSLQQLLIDEEAMELEDDSE